MRVVELQRNTGGVPYRWLRAVAMSAGAFTLLIFAMLLANHIALRRADPIHAPALLQLMADLKTNPQNAALREQIRDLDYLSRHAFFSSQRFQRISIFLMLIGASATAVAWKTLQTYQARVPYPSPHPPKEDLAKNAKWARSAVTAVGIVLAGLALSLSIPWNSPLDEALAPKKAARTKTAKAEDFSKNWPMFLGPSKGHALPQELPITWDASTGHGLKWKTPIPKPGFSSPIIWENRIFLTGADKAAREVYCVDIETGSILWTHAATGIDGSPGEAPKVSDDTSLAAPTMATDGERVFAIFGTGDLVALDFEGKRLWARNVGIPDNPYGHGSSLALSKDLLLVQFDQRKNGALLAIEAGTGEVRWKTAREFEPSWATPLVIGLGGIEQAILSAAPGAAAYDLKSGAELWKVQCLEHSEVAPSPLIANGILYVSGTDAGLSAIDLASRKVLWKRDEHIPGVSSPVIVGDLLFYGVDEGMILCLNARTGEQVWEAEADDGFYSSPIVCGGRIYLTDRSGATYVFAATNTFSVVGKAKLGEDVSATPAVKGKSLFIRGHKHLFRIGS